MRKALLSMFMTLCGVITYSQNTSSYIYETGTSNPVIYNQPQSRRIYGGSIIKVSYEGSNVMRNTKLQNAMAKACHLWEEQMPTCFPLKIAVRMGNLNNTTALARVETINGNDSVFDYGKLYLKKWYMYPLSEIPEENYTFEFFRDSPDIIITFTNRNVFDYSLSGNTNSGKYDFITVALQAFYKALDLSSLDNTLSSSLPDVQEGYVRSAFRDTSGPEETIVQSELSKNTVVRYLGDGMHDYLEPKWFINYIAVGMGGSVISDTTSCTYPVTAYQGQQSGSVLSTPINDNRNNNNVAQYLSQFYETSGGYGNFVMQNDGTWRKFIYYSNISENDNMVNARQVDGHLIIKTVTENGLNSIVTYSLYEYIPRKSTPVLISAAPFSLYGTNSVLARPLNRDDDEYMEVTIGFTDIEGCANILVEQVDEDYPFPTYYYVDPEDGEFVAIMNKNYKSTFTLHYINAHGETIGNPIEIDLSDFDTNALDMTVSFHGGKIEYNIFEKDMNSKAICTVKNLLSSETSFTRKVDNENGTIDISDLPRGLYLVTFTSGEKRFSTKIVK